MLQTVSPRRLRRAMPSLRPPGGRPPAPTGLHEIKHDGFRLMVRRDGSHDWAARYPPIAAAAAAVSARSFLINGEAVVAD